MSYVRRSMADSGPITDPSQVDDSIVVGSVPPTRVSCDALPADSPWRQPGQACAPSALDTVLDFFKGFTSSTPSTSPSTDPSPAGASSSSPSLLVLAALGGVGYYLYTKKKRP